MVKHVINDNQTTTYQIPGNRDSWVLTAGTTFRNEDGSALVITGNGNEFVNYGELFSQNNQSEDRPDYNTVRITGDETTFINHGSIGGDYSIGGTGGSLYLTNWSTINSGVSYAAGDGDIKLINQKGAYISGSSPHGNSVGDAVGLWGSDVTVINRGSIAGIRITGTTTATLTNDGTLSGNVEVSGKHASLINRGTIEHATIIVGGNNTFDARVGTLDDVALLGGAGNQIFQIDHAMTITDEGGRDIVQAACTYKLGDDSGIENLVLIGKKGLRAAGSDEDNHITGNSGNNRLAGGGGEDSLTGGKGHDEFVFNANSDNDTITDFTDGVDKIHIDGYKFIKFSALEHRIEQDGHDVLITVTKDHTITLENFHAKDLVAHDFLFS
jgi:Ca2+-binding RTX toxin-like protein